jgi:hypothetical protein
MMRIFTASLRANSLNDAKRRQCGNDPRQSESGGVKQVPKFGCGPLAPAIHQEHVQIEHLTAAVYPER